VIDRELGAYSSPGWVKAALPEGEADSVHYPTVAACGNSGCWLPRADETMIGVEARQLTKRERAVLEALLSVDLQGVDALRHQASEVLVVDTCGCGCPSVDFQHDRGLGMNMRVNANVPDSHDSLFSYTIEDPERGEILGGAGCGLQDWSRCAASSSRSARSIASSVPSAWSLSDSTPCTALAASSSSSPATDP